jgi:hypothetical protein
MLLTLAAILALAAAFAYLLWSVGAQYPDTSMRSADRPDAEERLMRRGSPLSTPPPARRPRRRLFRRPSLDPGDPGLPSRVAVDRGLAQLAIAEAGAAGATSRKLARASRALARGDALAASGHHEAALARYAKAWTAASQALEESM